VVRLKNSSLKLVVKPVSTATLSTKVYLQLRADVLAGRLSPGEKLRAEALRQRFSIASSPIREALNRLLSEGFVELEDQKGFRVTPVSESDLRDLVQARTWVDSAAIREGIRRRDVAWEESLVLALHRLSRVARHATLESSVVNEDWERLHRSLHFSLVEGCASKSMCRISMQLFDSAERYRLLAADKIPERDELNEHREIVNACLAHDSDKATQLLITHYDTTFAVIMSSARAPQ